MALQIHVHKLAKISTVIYLEFSNWLKVIYIPISKNNLQFSSVQFSRSVLSDSLPPHESQHTRPPCPSPTPEVHSDSRPSSQWCHPAISSSVVPFSSCPQSLPASESFPMSQRFTWGGQSTGLILELSNIKKLICVSELSCIQLLWSKHQSVIFQILWIWHHQNLAEDIQIINIKQ